MEPYTYLQEVARNLEDLDDRETIHKLLDELEFVYEALAPEFQRLATDLIERLNKRARSL